MENYKIVYAGVEFMLSILCLFLTVILFQLAGEFFILKVASIIVGLFGFLLTTGLGIKILRD